jgi:hypothetical protein
MRKAKVHTCTAVLYLDSCTKMLASTALQGDGQEGGWNYTRPVKDAALMRDGGAQLKCRSCATAARHSDLKRALRSLALSLAALRSGEMASNSDSPWHPSRPSAPHAVPRPSSKHRGRREGVRHATEPLTMQRGRILQAADASWRV